VALAAVLAIALLSNTAHAATSVWKISKGGNYFYLGGTVHVLAPSDYPLPAEFTIAYRDADVIVFETDMDTLKLPASQERFLSAITYSDDRTLESELKPGMYHKLEDYMAERDIPLAAFEKLQPWGAALMITILEYQRLGMEPAYGVDTHFDTLAHADGKQTLGLETLDEHLGAIRSMENMDPDTVVEYTLRDLAQLPTFSRTLKENWRSGDVAAFATDPMLLQMQAEFPEMYAALLTRRNNAWMKKLVTLADDSSREFVLVGALHLSGKDGLLQQLAARGFAVEQL